jgi:hypothetical protein
LFCNSSITLNGIGGYDASISQPVLITSSVLFFLGDSPMHADITNTPLPNNALNPCCMCTLSVPTQEQKHSKEYLYNFLQLDKDGAEKLNTPRVWEKTIEAIGFYSKAKEHERMAKVYGVKDWINEKFVESKRRPGVKVRVAELLKEDSSRLFNPFLKLKCKFLSCSVLIFFSKYIWLIVLRA